jgi:antitoxin (DNA-binding transcriptional repressor) of toxin-antitoxin stability system
MRTPEARLCRVRLKVSVRRGVSPHFFRGEGREVAEKGAGLTPAPSVKTLTITDAKKNLGRWLNAAARGEDIGIISGADIIALRKVEVASTDYAFREYGATPQEFEVFDRAAEQRYERAKREGKLAIKNVERSPFPVSRVLPEAGWGGWALCQITSKPFLKLHSAFLIRQFASAYASSRSLPPSPCLLLPPIGRESGRSVRAARWCRR